MTPATPELHHDSDEPRTPASSSRPGDARGWGRDSASLDLADVLPWMFPVGGGEARPVGHQPPPDDGWTVIAWARSPLEAEMIVATLRDADVEALADEPMLLPLDDALRQRRLRVHVRVRQRDRRAAEDALRRHVEASRDLDWDSVDVGERTDSIVGGRPRGAAILAIAIASVALAVLGATLLMMVVALLR